MSTWLVDYLSLLSDGLRTVLISGRGSQRLRRLGFLIAWVTVYPGFTLVNGLFMAMDPLLYGDLRREPLHRPLFILGNHRTGSTFLQRLLAQDRGTFATARLVDILFPSLLQKRLIAAIGRVDAKVGAPLARLVRWLDGRWGQDYRQVHPMGINLAEEDEFWLIMPLKSGAIWETFPTVKRFRRFFWTDAEMPAAEADRALRFYRACARRQRVFCGGATFLSKNPLWTPKAAALRRAFPEARFLVLVRDPRKVVPSTSSLLHAAWRGTGAVHDEDVEAERVHEICERFYDEPLLALEGLPPEQLAVVRFEDLRTDTLGTLQQVFGQLELPITEGLRKAIEE